MSDYTAAGYRSRRDYLESLADELGVPRHIAFTLAAVLGQSEDFDGLVTALEDYSDELEN